MSHAADDTNDFDLERFIDMFDTAITSTDPRVTNALRSLMMMVILTKPEGDPVSNGPFRGMHKDLASIRRRVNIIEERQQREASREEYEYRRLKEHYERTAQYEYSYNHIWDDGNRRAATASMVIKRMQTACRLTTP